MGNNANNAQSNNQDSKKNINDLEKLKAEIEKAHKIIEQQKFLITEMQNKLNEYNNTINNYENIIKEKDVELNNLQIQLNNNNVILKNFNMNEMMTVNFISEDKKINFAIPCIKTNIFAEVEEKLYKQYPEYRETNNNFVFNGAQILRFKTIDDNKIGNGLPVTLLVPS